MKHLKEYNSGINENYNQRKMIIKDDKGRSIEVELEGSTIKNIINNAMIRFPFAVGSYWNRSIETWACNNRFNNIETWMNGRKAREIDPCQEEKIFGIKTKDIPQGHELRLLYPGKFRK